MSSNLISVQDHPRCTLLRCSQDHFDWSLRVWKVVLTLFSDSIIDNSIFSISLSSVISGVSLWILFFSLVKSFSFIFCILYTANRKCLNASSLLSNLSNVSFSFSPKYESSVCILLTFFFIIKASSSFDLWIDWILRLIKSYLVVWKSSILCLEF